MKNNALKVTAIKVSSLGFSYGNGFSLKDISFDLSEGSILGLGGPNGSGKSTLLRLLMGLHRVPLESVELFGTVLENYGALELARSVAWVPQELSCPYPLRAEDFVLQGRSPHLSGLRFESERDRDLSQKALADCDAASLSHRFVATLSSGEMRRVMLARALAQETPLLLLDEPMSNLDLEHRLEFAELFKRLAAQGKTLVVVSHEIDMLARTCGRVLLLKEGRLAAFGKPKDVLTAKTLASVFRIGADLEWKDGHLILIPHALTESDLPLSES